MFLVSIIHFCPFEFHLSHQVRCLMDLPKLPLNFARVDYSVIPLIEHWNHCTFRKATKHSLETCSAYSMKQKCKSSRTDLSQSMLHNSLWSSHHCSSAFRPLILAFFRWYRVPPFWQIVGVIGFWVPTQIAWGFPGDSVGHSWTWLSIGHECVSTYTHPHTQIA